MTEISTSFNEKAFWDGKKTRTQTVREDDDVVYCWLRGGFLVRHGRGE
jgi:hypothetical protein